MDDTATWKLIHKERAAIADTLTTLTAEQWATPSLCGGWSVRETAAHIVLGAEQTTPHFLGRMAANGFRFNTMMDRDARRTGVQAPDELIARLRARVTTTNKPPAPAMTMLGEVVVHSDDIRRPLGLETQSESRRADRLSGDVQERQFPGRDQEADRRAPSRRHRRRLVSRHRTRGHRSGNADCDGHDRPSGWSRRARRRGPGHLAPPDDSDEVIDTNGCHDGNRLRRHRVTEAWRCCRG